MLWNVLRDRHSPKLAIEIDGGSHLGRQALDAARDADLGRLHGIRVWRVSARVVEVELAAVLGELAVVL